MLRARPSSLANSLHSLFTELMFNMKAAGIGPAVTPGWAGPLMRVPAHLAHHAPAGSRLQRLGFSSVLLSGTRPTLLPLSAAASKQQSADIKLFASASVPGLPPFIGKPAPSFRAVVKKVNHRGNGGSAILSVQVEEGQWKELVPYVKHKDFRKTIAQDSGNSKFYDKYKIKNRILTVVGTGMSSLGVGSTCQFAGKWQYSERFGLEVSCLSFTEEAIMEPAALKQRLKWLMEGVGDKTAGELVEALGVQAEKVLASRDAVGALVKKGFTAKKAQKLKAAYDKATSQNMTQQYLTDLGLKGYVVNAGVKRYGAEDFKARLKDDVYATLMDLPGFDLTTADRVARQLGTSADHPSRGAAAMLQAMVKETLSAGHSFVPFQKVRTATKRLLVNHDASWVEAEAKGSAAAGPERITDDLPFISSTKASREASGARESSSPAPTQPFVGLAEAVHHRASIWAAQLMRMKKVVLEVVNDPALPPFRLSADDCWLEDAATPTPTPTTTPTPTGSATTSQRPRSTSPATGSDSDAGTPPPPQVRPWPEHAMMYLDPLYSAEVQVSKTLGNMLAKIPQELLAQHVESSKQVLSLTVKGARSLAAAAVQAVQAGGDGAAANSPTGSSSSNGGGGNGGSGGGGRSGGQRPWYGAGKAPEGRVAEQYVWQAQKKLLQQEVELTEKQVDAVYMAMSAPVMLLTGAAGCGKTFGTKAIMAVLLEQHKKIMLCAPTGRAAQRLQEAGTEYALTASTVHRLLGYKPLLRLTDEDLQGEAAKGGIGPSIAGGNSQVASDASSADAASSPDLLSSSAVLASKLTTDLDQYAEHMFVYNSSNLLPAHAVIVDEASMLDVQLAAALMRALPSHCQLILIGDPNQLPPVGPGSVLQDMISTGVFPQVHLDTIFRQSSGSNIITGAHQVMHGRSPVASTLPGTTPPVDPDFPAGVETLPAHKPATAHIHTNQPSHASSGMPAVSSKQVLDIIQSIANGNVGQGNGYEASDLARRRASPVQPLMPTYSDEDDGQGAGQAIARLQGALGGDGVVVMEPGTEVEAAQTVVDLITALKSAGVDVAANVQVLSPTKDTPAGVGNLNRLLQPLMNPTLRPDQRVAADSTARIKFKLGDRVVQVENNYDTGVFNGDLGRVIGINEREGITKVQFAARPGSDTAHDVPYHGVELSQLHLAWATTVHKAQGAEYPVVVMLMHHGIARTLQQRKLLYTAITRGRKLVFLVTTPSALQNAVMSITDKPRNTLLQARTLRVLQQTCNLPDFPSLPYPDQALMRGSAAAFAQGIDVPRRRTRAARLVSQSVAAQSPAPVMQEGQVQGGEGQVQGVQGMRVRRRSSRTSQVPGSPALQSVEAALSSTQLQTDRTTTTRAFASASPAPLTMDVLMFGQRQPQPGLGGAGQQGPGQATPPPPPMPVVSRRRSRRSLSASTTTTPNTHGRTTTPIPQQGAEPQPAPVVQGNGVPVPPPQQQPQHPAIDTSRTSPPAPVQTTLLRSRKARRFSQLASASPGTPPVPAGMAASEH